MKAALVVMKAKKVNNLYLLQVAQLLHIYCICSGASWYSDAQDSTVALGCCSGVFIGEFGFRYYTFMVYSFRA